MWGGNDRHGNGFEGTLTGSVDAALALQRPAADDALRVVATGGKTDPVP
jgi:hypothetical protein